MDPTHATRRLAIYARSATAQGADAAIERQLDRARDAIAHAGGDPTAARVYTDHNASGISCDRPGLVALIEAIEAGELDAVILERAARLSRDLHAFARIARRVDGADVALVCLDGSARVAMPVRKALERGGVW